MSNDTLADNITFSVCIMYNVHLHWLRYISGRYRRNPFKKIMLILHLKWHFLFNCKLHSWHVKMDFRWCNSVQSSSHFSFLWLNPVNFSAFTHHLSSLFHFSEFYILCCVICFQVTLNPCFNESPGLSAVLFLTATFTSLVNTQRSKQCLRKNIFILSFNLYF